MIRLAVLGSPIEHSLSPIIHDAAYKYLGITAQYEKFEVRESGFSEFILEHPADIWRGFSLTMPLKEIAFEAASKFEPRALQAGAINTLVANEGSWRGFNTDVSGFSGLFKSIEFEEVSILGAGGTARAALVALSDYPAKIKVYRRSSKRDTSLFKANANIEISDWGSLSSAFKCDLLINCTPAGALDALAESPGKIAAAIDSLYSPWPPPLFRLAKAATFFSGKDLLVSQAIEQISLFSNSDFARDDMFKRLRSLI